MVFCPDSLQDDILSSGRHTIANYPIRAPLAQFKNYLTDTGAFYFDVVPAVDGGCPHVAAYRNTQS